MRRFGVLLLLIIAACFIASRAITVFVVQPIGAVPEGGTLIIDRRTTTTFMDSADAWCARIVGGVNLLCRAGALAGIGKGTVYARLPYSNTLYLISTGGVAYEK